jgi:hypothetical protein
VSELSVEETVAEVERMISPTEWKSGEPFPPMKEWRTLGGIKDMNSILRAIIADWRKRGDALADARLWIRNARDLYSIPGRAVYETANKQIAQIDALITQQPPESKP